MNPFKEFKVYGCALPTAANRSPQIYVMQVFAKNEIQAHSTFFKLSKQLHKIKSTKGVIIRTVPIVEECVAVSTYGINFKYRSRNTACHNMYKELRGVSKADVVNDLYNDMAGRHSVGRRAVDIISVDKVSEDKIRRESSKVFGNEEVEFPVFGKWYAGDEFVEEGAI